MFILSSVSDKLFSSMHSIDHIIQDSDVRQVVQDVSIIYSHRVIIPFFWEEKQEWLLIIIDNSSSSVHIIYTAYESVSLSKSNNKDRSSLSNYLSVRIKSILQELKSFHALASASMPNDWLFLYCDPFSATIQNLNRTPNGRSGVVKVTNDSGIYVSYAIECDYYDAPLFAENTDWTNFRKKIAYCILNWNLPLT